MAQSDLVTPPFRLGFAATERALVLDALVSAEGPVRREGGYVERLPDLTLSDLAGRLPRARRRPALGT